MMRTVLRLSLVLLVLNQVIAPCEGWGSDGGRVAGKDSEGYMGQTYLRRPMPPSLLLEQLTTRRGLGISAWGIVILIVSLILAGMGFYYFSMCYPAFCMNRKKYNNMGMPSVA